MAYCTSTFLANQDFVKLEDTGNAGLKLEGRPEEAAVLE
jgi:hypothetical protein